MGSSSTERAQQEGRPSVVLVDHHDSYTWNLAHLIAGVTGELPTVAQWTDPTDVSAFTHIVLSPGPGHPDEYDWSVLDLGRPVLGVCLGMQGIVTHLGGTVERVPPAHGREEDVRHGSRGVFAGLPSPMRAVRYHSLAATSLPAALEATAWAADGTVLGVRHRALPIEGVQFHPESILSQYGEAIMAHFLGRAG